MPYLRAQIASACLRILAQPIALLAQSANRISLKYFFLWVPPPFIIAPATDSILSARDVVV